ncbi:MAG: CHAD domain-containing protein [Acidobacteriia bacterium]|nr:CHAD domain-containing protein [Terriglobia bacterium]
MKNSYRLKWDERAGAAANARRRLPALAAAFFALVRKLLAQDPSPEKMHCLRLETKRLRYTLELFRPCYGPGLETRLAALRRLQNSLGELNDSAVAERMLVRSMDPSPQRARVLRFLQQRTAAKAHEFRKDWTSLFDAPGQESWWREYLRRNARAPVRRPPP